MLKNKMFDVEEHNKLVPLKVPSFMDGQDYWELFDDMMEHRNFLLLGLFKKNFLVEDHTDYKELI